MTVSPCFTPGTRIATERGAVPVEDILRGDRLVTRDNGLKRVAWIGRRDFGLREIEATEALRPVLVRAGALGRDRPHRDLIVSPHHRFLIGNGLWPRTGRGDEALVAARDLVDGRGIRPARMLGVSYIHVLCSAHEVILADGAWTESFHPDDTVFRGLAEAQRQEILAVFPEVATMGAARRFRAARPIRKSRFET